MKPLASGQLSVVSWFARVSCLLLAAFCQLACSVPNLEDPDCTQARDGVHEFYSFHFGNDMTFSNENLEKRNEYLTPRFFQELRDHPPPVDPFTRTEDTPKAFRVGDCRVAEPGSRVRFDVLLFWKTDVRTEQRPIGVESAKVDGRWLVDRVE
jgi:hypothetical protein